MSSSIDPIRFEFTFDESAYLRYERFARGGKEVTGLRLAKTKTDKFLKFVPSGVATVAELQTKGFAYLKVG